MRFYVYCTEGEVGAIRARAREAGVSVSVFLRRAALGRELISITDQRTAGELRRLGAMLKHLYPKNSNWTAQETHRYWLGHAQLMLLARNIERRIAEVA
ncbi:MAG: plasmid mobilization protein [Thiobacillaceae bacterium]